MVLLPHVLVFRVQTVSPKMHQGRIVRSSILHLSEMATEDAWSVFLNIAVTEFAEEQKL